MPRLPAFDPVGHRPRVGPLQLPSEGFQGLAPDWPLEGLSEPEASAWAQVWATPQAHAWSAMGSGVARVIARYCRVIVAAERPGAEPALLSQANTLEDRLGLTPKAMRAMLWTITDHEPAVPRPISAARGRIKAV